jgi:hypothetical protein
LDLGFYTNALISTENAARTAGLYYNTSKQQSSDVTKACYYALEVLRKQPNVGSGVTTCASSATAVSQAAPVALTTSSVSAGPDGQPATTVWVTYQTISMIPIPGLLTGQLTVTRSAQFKQ